MWLVAYIGIGSAVGGITRFLVGTLIQQRLPVEFPLGTLVVNITGSFILGFLLRYALATPAISAEVRALLTTGFCGGYTTFSTFSYETATLLEGGNYRRAVFYIVASVLVALIGTFLGFDLARSVLAFRERV